MIKNLYRLGKALQTDEANSDYFAPWQNPFPSKKAADLGKVLYFSIEKGVIRDSYELEPFKPKMLKAYLYRKLAGARAAPLVPTDYFYPKKKEEDHQEGVRKLVDRLRRSFPDGESLFFPSEAHKEAALEKVEQELLAFTGDLENRYLITFKVDGKWLGEFEEHIQLFEADAYGKYYQKSSAKNKLCSVTYENVPEVWGRVDTLGFTVDTNTFSRSGFNDKDSYKMFPVGPDSVKVLEGARRYAMEQLARSFYSLRYIIVPHFIEERDDLMLKAADLIGRRSESASLEGESKSIFGNEKVIARLAEKGDIAKSGVFYDILFYEENQAQFAIKVHLTDIMPSRFRAVFEAKGKIEKRFRQVNRITTKEENVEFYLTFRTIHRYFSSVINKKTVFHPFFFTILESVFYGQRLDERTVLDAFMAKIRLEFKQRVESPNRYIFRAKEAFALWHFFLELQLFTNKKTYEMNEKPVPRTLEAFVEEHQAFFEEPYKRAAFYMGCLVELLLAAQRRNLGSEPFLEKLQSLNIDEKELKKIFPKLLEKISQYHDSIEKYKRDYVQQLKAQIVPVLLQPTKVNRVEISFAFTAGMVMQKEFTSHEIETKKAEKAKADSES